MLARVRTILFFALLLGVGSSVRAQQGAVAEFTISGTSTVRNWSCPATGTVKILPGKTAAAVPGFPNGIQTVTIAVPVTAIACEDKTMVEHVIDTLKANEFPEMVYTITGYTLAAGDTINATGTLKIFTVAKPLNLEMRLRNNRVSGDTTIDLTEWTVVPPVIFQGLLKVGKDVRIRFDAPLQP